MEYQFAPWRIQYIKQETTEKKEGDCILCYYPALNDDEPSLILYRGKYNFVIMNRYPYNAGHIMVAPLRHCGALEGLDEEERNEHFAIVAQCEKILREVFRCQGFNIGMNIGRVAGAGVDYHIHTHIVPRWNGDTNFMPVIANTKVINEAIAETYRALSPYFAKFEVC
ncbi:MAG: HIT domain-containing protein [Dehalococcoidia bacterium]|nr:HIT domain-containing protein [Dehalococcoidia bacterium]